MNAEHMKVPVRTEIATMHILIPMEVILLSSSAADMPARQRMGVAREEVDTFSINGTIKWLHGMKGAVDMTPASDMNMMTGIDLI